LKQGGLKNDGPALLQFFKSRSVDDAQKKKIEALIELFSSEDFDQRERASEEIIQFGIGAVGLLRQAERTTDVEVLRRLQRCLAIIEKVSTAALSQAAARQLARLKPDGTIEVLLSFLPFADDEVLSEEIRTTLSVLAMKDNTPAPALLAALKDSNTIRRGAAAQALARGGDKTIREQMKAFLANEKDPDARMLIVLDLVTYAKEKPLVPDLIRLLPDVQTSQIYRAEEILYALAGETPPSVPSGSDAASRKKISETWLDWWSKNEAKIDLAKLDNRERLLGFTVVMEMDVRGVGGRVIEVGPDNKARWKIENLQFPSDAVVLPGNRVIVAEHNSNRVSERDMTGKEIWAVQVNQPVNLQRLPNGNTFVVGRSGIAEFDRNQKQVLTVNRPEYDIVSGQRMRNGEILYLTQRGQIVRLDKEGKQVKVYSVGRTPYWGGLEVQANGKVLFTQIQGVAELDLNSGETTQVVTYTNGSSCQKLPNGNILVTGMNRMHVAELDRTSKVVWEYKSAEANYRPWRAFRR
jgi:HEAT repeat protein